MEDPTILDEPLDISSYKKIKRRRDLLPVWIKVFIWIFMAMGGIAVLGWFSGLAGFRFTTSLYGLSSSEPLTEVGIILMLIFLIKFLVAFGLWTEMDWAVNIGLVDAILGIGVCLFVMFALPFLGGERLITHSNGVTQFTFFNFKLELLFLIPYLIRLQKIRKQWSSF